MSIKNLYDYIEKNETKELISLVSIIQEITNNFEECNLFINQLRHYLDRDYHRNPNKRYHLKELTDNLNNIIIKAIKINKSLDYITFENYYNFKNSPLSNVISDILDSKKMTIDDNSVIFYNDYVFIFLKDIISDEDLFELFKINSLYKNKNLKEFLEVINSIYE